MKIKKMLAVTPRRQRNYNFVAKALSKNRLALVLQS